MNVCQCSTMHSAYVNGADQSTVDVSSEAERTVVSSDTPSDSVS